MGYNLKINYADKSNYGAYRDTSKIKYIVWHYTANDGDTDEANANYFKRKNLKASAHYFVDDDSITISVPDTYVAWSVGGSRYSNYKTTGGAKYYKICTNSNSLNIELCDTVRNDSYNVSEKTLNNAIELTRDLMKKYNIPIENIIRHFDVTGKSCPAYFVNNTKWNAVKTRISNLTTVSTPITTSPTVTVSTNSYIVVKGDTLSKIGEKTGIAWKTIATLNGIKPPYIIKVGQVLKLSNTTSSNTVSGVSTKKYVHNGVDYSLVFDPLYYANKYNDLKKHFGINDTKLFNHFIQYGMKEGRQAINTFNPVIYKNRYRDLQKAFGNDMNAYYKHYINYGYKEKRKAV